MNEKINGLFKKLDKQLTDLLEELKPYSEDQLNRPPAKGGWSAIQTMHHLMLSEHYAHAYIKKKLSFSPELKKAGMAAGFRSSIVNTYLGFPFKFKAPEAVSGGNLPEEASFWETAKRWKKQREEFKVYLGSLPADFMYKELYKHPMVGKLSAKGMISFFDAHFRRHRKQIRKVLKEMVPARDHVSF